MVPPHCFTGNTNILTPSGYKNIKELNDDDIIITSNGKHVKIKVYQFIVDETDKSTAPYIFPIGSLGPNFPSKEIELSENHMIKDINGIWQRPKDLYKTNLNIRQAPVGSSLVYYNIRCPNYFEDFIVLEGGLIIESYGKDHNIKGVTYYWDGSIKGFIKNERHQIFPVPKNPNTVMIFSY